MMRTNSSSSASPTSNFELIPEEAEPGYDNQSQEGATGASSAAASVSRAVSFCLKFIYIKHKKGVENYTHIYSIGSFFLDSKIS